MKHCFAIALLLVCTEPVSARDSTTVPSSVPGGVYDRPYLFRPSTDFAVGGYAEIMFRSEHTDGIHEGSSFEARRFNLFFYSAIAQRVRLTAELEFEHGTEEIKLETAQLDLEFVDELNLRAGIILSPLGRFNLAHDSPRNEFNERPLVSTLVIPSTLSEAGIGIFGALDPSGGYLVMYETYLVNGFDDGVILSGEGTSIPDGRPSSFEGDNNGSPSVVGRIALRPPFGGEVGVSGHTGIYNTHVLDGLVVDERRWLTIIAVDGMVGAGGVQLEGEFARAELDVPPSLSGLYAGSQQGFFVQATVPLWNDALPMFPGSVLGAGIRYDEVDLDRAIDGDMIRGLTLGATMRFVPETVVKVDYQHRWRFDRLGNESRSAVIQVGFATYF